MRTGAIVARFQVASLHKGHLHLIDRVKEKCDKLVILLGEPELPNKRNPLPFEIRKQMIMEAYPDAIFYQIRDHHEDKTWSENLDKILSQHENVTLFGSRDSFSSFYTGTFPYEAISELEGFNGTETREKILSLTDTKMNTESFRQGIIYGYNLRTEIEKDLFGQFSGSTFFEMAKLDE